MMDYTDDLPDEEDFLYTLIQYIPKHDTEKQIAILLTYATIEFHKTDQFSSKGWHGLLLNVNIQLPVKAFEYIESITSPFSDEFLIEKDELENKLQTWMEKILPWSSGFDIGTVKFSVKVQGSYDGWRDEVLLQLIGRGITNQAAFKSTYHPMCEYNGMKFRSKSEMRLAEHFEQSDVLFFPLPLANYQGQTKEPDYLVCKDGRWAILECVSDQYHPSVEKEANRDVWFQDHHIEIRKYSAAQCFNEPAKVVSDFINWLDSKR